MPYEPVPFSGHIPANQLRYFPNFMGVTWPDCLECSTQLFLVLGGHSCSPDSGLTTASILQTLTALSVHVCVLFWVKMPLSCTSYLYLYKILPVTFLEPSATKDFNSAEHLSTGQPIGIGTPAIAVHSPILG